MSTNVKHISYHTIGFDHGGNRHAQLVNQLVNQFYPQAIDYAIGEIGADDFSMQGVRGHLRKKLL